MSWVICVIIFPLLSLFLLYFSLPSLSLCFLSWLLSLYPLLSLLPLPSSIWSSLPPLLQMLSAPLHQSTNTYRTPTCPIYCANSWGVKMNQFYFLPSTKGRCAGLCPPLPVPPTSISWNMFYSPVFVFLFCNMAFFSLFKMIFRKIYFSLTCSM